MRFDYQVLLKSPP